MNLVKLVRFCIDFMVPVPKGSVASIFKRASPNNHDLTFDQFKDMIERLFVEVNKLKINVLKKRLKITTTNQSESDSTR